MQPRNKLLVAGLALLAVACAHSRNNLRNQDYMPAKSRERADTVESRAHVKDAMRSIVICAKGGVSEVDDGISDAQTVALALALRCSTEYQQSIKTFGAAKSDDEETFAIFREKQYSTQSKIETFLPFVMDYRASLRKRNSEKETSTQ